MVKEHRLNSRKTQFIFFFPVEYLTEIGNITTRLDTDVWKSPREMAELLTDQHQGARIQ